MATITFTGPVVGGSENTWGTIINSNFTVAEDALNGVTQIEPALVEGGWEIGATTILATGAELNLLDGVTYTLTNLNSLTASITELNYSSGVTSAIQTQIDDKQSQITTLLGNNSGTIEPATPVANQWWFDETSFTLNFRDMANSSWVTIGKVDQSQGEWKPHIGGVRVTDFLDEDDMATDKATAVASQQSIKAYVDNLITKTGTAPVFGVRAFCVWDGTGSTGATTPQASGNIGTLTKDASGQWTVTFTTSMPDANYAVTYASGTTSASKSAQNTVNVFSTSASGFSFTISDATGNDYRDGAYNSFTVVR